MKSLKTNGQTDNRQSDKLTWTFSSGKLNLVWIPFTQRCFVPSLFEEQLIFTIFLLSFLGKCWDLLIQQTWISFTQGKFGWNCSSGSGREDENVKSLQTDTHNKNMGMCEGASKQSLDPNQSTTPIVLKFL